MNLWQQFERGRTKLLEESKGFSMHFEKGIDERLKKLYVSVGRWLRQNYIFPVHVNIYILNSETITLQNGRIAYGSFRWFEKRTPHIRIPSKPDKIMLAQYSADDIHEQIISSLIHELTHYFQWVSGHEQSNTVSERQANYYRYRIIEKYYDSLK